MVKVFPFFLERRKRSRALYNVDFERFVRIKAH